MRQVICRYSRKKGPNVLSALWEDLFDEGNELDTDILRHFSLKFACQQMPILTCALTAPETVSVSSLADKGKERGLVFDDGTVVFGWENA